MRVLEATGFINGDILVDDEDYELASSCNWYIAETGNNYQTVMASIDGKHISLARFILEVDGIIDHKNGNTLDNTRNNLRSASHQQNLINRSKFKGFYTSKYKGVSKRNHTGTFVARICYNRKVRTIGTFKNEFDAALAYNFKTTELHGEFANMNQVGRI